MTLWLCMNVSRETTATSVTLCRFSAQSLSKHLGLGTSEYALRLWRSMPCTLGVCLPTSGHPVAPIGMLRDDEGSAVSGG